MHYLRKDTKRTYAVEEHFSKTRYKLMPKDSLSINNEWNSWTEKWEGFSWSWNCPWTIIKRLITWKTSLIISIITTLYLAKYIIFNALPKFTFTSPQTQICLQIIHIHFSHNSFLIHTQFILSHIIYMKCNFENLIKGQPKQN